MTLYEKIVAIYPELAEDTGAFMTVISLRDDSDGRGAYIEKWGHPTLPRPTEEQLEAN